jgi:hypothetical protein
LESFSVCRRRGLADDWPFTWIANKIAGETAALSGVEKKIATSTDVFFRESQITSHESPVTSHESLQSLLLPGSDASIRRSRSFMSVS